MSCRAFEKWISDGLDGNLSDRKRRKLDRHLGQCAACRSFELGLEKLQSEAKTLSDPIPPPAYWENAIARLESKLAAIDQAGRKAAPLPARQTPAFFPGVRWAWAGAASAIALGLGLYFFIFQSRGFVETSPLAFRDQVNSLYEKIGDNTDLETEFNSLIRASILEEAGESDGEVKHLLYGNSRFLDSLSDEEVQILDAEITRVLKI